MLATQVPLIEVQAAQALLVLQPAAGEPESWRKALQALAPRATVENGIGVLEVSGVLAYRPDLGEMFFDGFEASAEVLSAFHRLEADPEAKAIILNVNSPGVNRMLMNACGTRWIRVRRGAAMGIPGLYHGKLEPCDRAASVNALSGCGTRLSWLPASVEHWRSSPYVSWLSPALVLAETPRAEGEARRENG